MEEKKNRELSPEELDKVTGGVHDSTENRRDEEVLYKCSLCGECFSKYKEYSDHVRKKHSAALT